MTDTGGAAGAQTGSGGQRGKRVLRQVGGVAAVIAVGFGVNYYQGNKAEDDAPKVGDCARPVGDNDIKKVSCGDPQATLFVTSRVDDSNDGQTACAADQQASSYFVYDSDTTDFVICLMDR